MSEETFTPFQPVLVRDHDNQYWRASFFSHEFACDVPRLYHTISGAYRQCIPYNEETAHLLGTGNSPKPPEPEFEWGDHVEVKNMKDPDWKKAVFLYKTEQYFMALKEGDSYPSVFGFCRHADW